MNILDYIIIGILLIAGLTGFKKGVIGAVVAFVGTLLVIILAFYLKNPISEFMYEHLPFFNVAGSTSGGVNVVSILIYEGLSYLITIVILSFIMGIFIKISGIFSKIVNSSIILTLPSKILGLICGLVEGYIIAFIVIFLISLIAPASTLTNSSKYASGIIDKTPVLSAVVKDTKNCVNEVYGVLDNYENTNNKDNANLESLGILLKYEILTVDSADTLIKKGKINTPGAKDIIDIYRKKAKN